MDYKKHILEHRDLLAWLEKHLDRVEELANQIWSTLQSGGKIILAGNGGSFGDAQHIAAELVGRFVKHRPSYAATALGTNSSTITAVANDYSFDEVFKRELEGIARPNDLFIPISTSGNSQNLVKACNYALSNQIQIFGLLGRDGGKVHQLAGTSIVVPSDSTARIQEIHILIGHLVCAKIDEQS